MTSESPAYQTPPSYKRIYVSWHEQWTLQRYVDHYLQERKLALTAELRRAVIRRIEKFPGKGTLKKADMDFYLDSNAAELTGKS